LLFSQGPGVAYSRLVKPTAGPERKGDEILIVGDVAERWDQPDDATYIFKLRPGSRFHNIPPVEGRELTAEAIVYSFTRQRELRPTASFLPQIEKIEAPDRQTLRISLGRPDADFLPTLAAAQNVIVAREAVDLKGDLKEGPTIGSGPWISERWEPNSVARVRK